MFQHVDAYPGDPILTLNEDVVAVWSGENANGSGAGKQERSKRYHRCYQS